MITIWCRLRHQHEGEERFLLPREPIHFYFTNVKVEVSSGAAWPGTPNRAEIYVRAEKTVWFPGP